MSPATRVRGLVQFNVCRVKVEFPDAYVDAHPHLSILAGDHLGNLLQSRAAAQVRRMASADASMDASRPYPNPQDVNAYYRTPPNELRFPAAIVQSPLLGLAADETVVLGAVGAIVGHMLTRFFDDHGRLDDTQGNWRTGGGRRTAVSAN